MIDIEAPRRGVGGVFQLRRSRSALCSPQRPAYSMSQLGLTSAHGAWLPTEE